MYESASSRRVAPDPSASAPPGPDGTAADGSAVHYDRRHILIVLLIPLAMSLLQVSSVNVVLPVIQNSTGASSGQLQWVLSGYALTLGITLAPAGRIGDLIGRAEVFIIGVALFTLTSGACGLVSHPTTLNACRFLQGIAAGLYSPQVTGIIQQYFRGQARAKAFSLFGFVVSVSVALGPIMSGTLISWLGPNIGWRGSFLINLPLGLIAVIAAFYVLPRETGRRRNATTHTRLDLDPLGMALLVLCVLGIMLPFVTHGSPAVWTLLPVAACLGIAWVLWELHYARRGHQPMVDLRLFTLPSFSFNMGVSSLQFLGTTSVFALVAIFIQQGLGKSALAAALIGLPNAVAAAVTSLWVARYAITRGRGLQIVAVAAIAFGIAFAGFAAVLAVLGYPLWWMSIGLGITGVGQGAMTSINQTQAMIDIPQAQGSIAGGMMQTVQRIATAIGTAMMTGILFGVVERAEAVSLHTWAEGIALSFGVITAVMMASLAVAFSYWWIGHQKMKALGLK